MTPTDEQRALADKIFWEGESFARGHDGLFGEELAALLAESEAKAVERGQAALREKIHGWALSLPEDFHWDWLRNEMLASLHKQPEEPKP